MEDSAKEASIAAPDLTPEQREWLIRSEALWRRAHAIVSTRPNLDVGDVYHALRSLELSATERLRRGLSRVRTSAHRS